MTSIVKTRLVKIGNSQGIRPPLIACAAHRPRQGWEEGFRQMAAQGDDRLLDGDAPLPTAWEAGEWQW